MKPFLLHCPPRRAAPPLVDPSTSMSVLLGDLAARMTPQQRGAFLAKMAAMEGDRGALSAATFTLGRG